MIERGTIFTPDKKALLISEVQDELNKINSTLRNALGEKMLIDLNKIKEKLSAYLKELTDMKGVVTPAKTDEILEAISLSKKTRLETQYLFGLQNTALWFVVIVGISVAVYFNYKKKQ
jgi:hypothetical protein